MKKELQDKLFKEFDYMFRKRNLDMSQTCMCWGIETADGWFDLLYDLCTRIQVHINRHQELKEFSVEQVKEKFGTLRFYTNNSDETIDKLIDEAEVKSGITCETCGKPGKIKSTRGWLSCTCEECMEKN